MGEVIDFKTRQRSPAPVADLQKELAKIIYRIKDENNLIETKKENISLKKQVDELTLQNKKLYETKSLINQYKNVMNQKNRDIERLIIENEKLNANFEKIPNFIRKIFSQKV